jgi:Phage tail assembly chaperone proteins, E, or 41 or 14
MNKPIREGFVAADEVEKPADVVTPAAAEAAAAAAEPIEPTLPDEPFKEEWPIKVKLLYKKIRDNKGRELDELSFRQPTGGDINRHGMPVRIDNIGDIHIDERKMTFMMTALTGVMTPFLEQMDPRDWAACAYRLRSFFLPDPGAW